MISRSVYSERGRTGRTMTTSSKETLFDSVRRLLGRAISVLLVDASIVADILRRRFIEFSL